MVLEPIRYIGSIRLIESGFVDSLDFFVGVEIFLKVEIEVFGGVNLLGRTGVVESLLLGGLDLFSLGCTPDGLLEILLVS